MTLGLKVIKLQLFYTYKRYKMSNKFEIVKIFFVSNSCKLIYKKILLLLILLLCYQVKTVPHYFLS